VIKEMKIFTVNYDLNKKVLRKFGFTLGIILLGLFAVVLPFIFKIEPSPWLINTSIIFTILAFIFPYMFKPIFIILDIISNMLGSLIF